MKRIVWMVLLLVGIVGSASAQRDDLYFVPKKKVKVEKKSESTLNIYQKDETESSSTSPLGGSEGGHTLSVTTVPAKLLEMDEDTYNRRGSYLTDEGDAVSEFAMDDEGFVLITEEGDTMWTDADTLRLTRVEDGEGWVNGFDGSDSDYEYAMRIIRFRNPRYAIPVSSPLYWDVVYGGALWPSWDWNIYDDGIYAYVFPTSSNWYYWDYRMSYPFGWSAWSSPYYHGCHWGHHWGGHYYSHLWYDPWCSPHFHGYHPGWHHGHHHGYYPHYGAGKPGWGGSGPKAYPNHRTSASASTRQPSQTGASSSRGSVSTSSASRTGSSTASSRTGSSSVRVVTGRTGSTSSAAGAVRSSSSSRTGSNDEVVRRSTGSSSVSRSSSGSSSRSSYSSGSSGSSRSGYSSSSSSMSRSSGSTSSYSRPSSTRSSSSSSVNRSSSSGSSRSSYSSGSSRSSYSSGSSHSSYSSGSSHSSSYSSGSSRSGGSYSGGSSSRSGGSGRR